MFGKSSYEAGAGAIASARALTVGGTIPHRIDVSVGPATMPIKEPSRVPVARANRSALERANSPERTKAAFDTALQETANSTTCKPRMLTLACSARSCNLAISALTSQRVA